MILRFERTGKPDPSTLYSHEGFGDLISPMEKYQAELLELKHPIVQEKMLQPDKLIRIFKCVDRFCAFASNVMGTALVHWRQHELIGSDCFYCPYCDKFQEDEYTKLIYHIYRMHGECCYCCSQCFYRAKCKQSVESHLKRMHGIKPVAGISVLRTKSHLLNMPMPAEPCLTEAQAVLNYKCKQVIRRSNRHCNFQTPYLDVFYNHNEWKHRGSALHPCAMCHALADSATALIIHMRAHELKQYQCTYCLYGADCGIQLVSHFSGHHPNKRPSTYLRSCSPRALPKATLNMPTVTSRNMTRTIIIDDNPIAEVENSIELEVIFVPRVMSSKPRDPGTSHVIIVSDDGDEDTLLFIITPQQGPLPQLDFEPMVVDEPVASTSKATVSEIITLDDSDDEDYNPDPKKIYIL